jgi:hypothetical protein
VKLVPDDVTIRITVSENHSPDSTRAMLDAHSFRNGIRVHLHSENIGALRNIWSLYEISRAQYAWIHSDDDIPKPGAISKVVEALRRYEPTVLTFEFEQPVGSQLRRHGAGEGVEIITDMGTAVVHLLILGKLTKYVIRREMLPEALVNLPRFRDTGYGWQAVILEVLKLSVSRSVAIIHEPLASCDELYQVLLDELTPQYWEDQVLLFDHEFVRQHCPAYAESRKRGHLRYMVMLIYGTLAGVMQTRAPELFRDHGRQLPFHSSYLRNPAVALEWLSLRLGLPAFSAVYDIADRLGRLKARLTSRPWR